MIGKSPSWQDAGGACSGYLVEHAAGLLLVDCGNGVFGKLRAATDYGSVRCVVISHMHADHFLDLIPFSYALTYGPKLDSPAPKLFLPPGGLSVLRTICGSFDAVTLVEDAFEAVEYDPATGIELDSVKVEFKPVPHFIEAWALRISEADSSFVFGADSGPDDGIAEFASGADLLLLEATFSHDAPSDLVGHLNPTQAGRIAAQSGVSRLVLTHISDLLDLDASQAAAAAEFSGPVEVAAEGSSWTV